MSFSTVCQDDEDAPIQKAAFMANIRAFIALEKSPDDFSIKTAEGNNLLHLVILGCASRKRLNPGQLQTDDAIKIIDMLLKQRPALREEKNNAGKTCEDLLYKADISLLENHFKGIDAKTKPLILSKKCMPPEQTGGENAAGEPTCMLDKQAP